MAEPSEYDGTNAEVLEPIATKEDVIIHLIKNTEQQPHLNHVRMVTQEEDENEEDGDDESNSDSDNSDV